MQAIHPSLLPMVQEVRALLGNVLSSQGTQVTNNDNNAQNNQQQVR